MTDTAKPLIRLEDYTPPAFLIDSVTLKVDIQADTQAGIQAGIQVDSALIYATLQVRRNPLSLDQQAPLVLDGEALQTLDVALNGEMLAESAYALTENQLTLLQTPTHASFSVTTTVRLLPHKNTQLSGFYQSQDGLFTQCEAQGFRRITWFLDRPDVMSVYRVSIHADKARYPILLANGNPVEQGDEAGGRHYAVWVDPHKKPAYLFAMVAARLDVVHDTYRTASGREVKLAIYVTAGKLDQCAHAMRALKLAMRWDEENFGLECDLDHYMIVAVGDFNMGAMENKGLNIFNTKYVLARPDVATDSDFENIDRVVAHEYFHNWTGNRVTCRDWFQLSLKEGLTVFRDQQFGADMHHPSVARIREVRNLRAIQFPEDAGSMAHPVRPSVYLEINNFYTSTVYEKGAEVVRMLHTLIGKKAFRRGMEIYFARHDGQAVTCDDFVAAMAAAHQESGATSLALDFTQFMRWYAQAGTPHVQVQSHYDAGTQRFNVQLSQRITNAQDDSPLLPLLIPIDIALFSADGTIIPFADGQKSRVILLTKATQEFVFEKIPVKPVPSLLRNFSAPVMLDYPYSDSELALLMAHDSDPFNRWEAAQRGWTRLILAKTTCSAAEQSALWPTAFIEAARHVLRSSQNLALTAEIFTLPNEATLAEQLTSVDPERLYQARSALLRHLATTLEAEWLACYQRLSPPATYSLSADDVARRQLRQVALNYLNELDTDAYRALAHAQFAKADNMTERFAALSVLVQHNAAEQALADFYAQWAHEALVVDKWLMVQATSRADGTLAKVRALTEHPAFNRQTPNKVYALLRAFGQNHRHFHAADGAGYRFMAEEIRALDPLNPQVAARLARAFDRWKKFSPLHQRHAREALASLHQQRLSEDVFEIIDKALR